MKDILKFIDVHPYMSGGIAFFILFYCIFFYFTYTNISDIVQDLDADWQKNKEDNFNELE